MSIYGPKSKSNMLPEDSLIDTLNSLIDTLNSLINTLNTLIKSSDNNNLDTMKSKSSEPKQIKLSGQPVNSVGPQQNTAKSYITNM